MRILIVAAAVLASACVSVNANITESDEALTAIQSARMRECPAERTRDNARADTELQSVGVTGVDIGFVPLASDPTRSVRLRRLTIAPGGVIGWHDHSAVQGMALVVSGEMVEFRNTCLDPMTYRAGDVAREDATTAYGWRNETDEDAVVLTAHVVVR
ncbi:MAG: cupin domain-containing protein [Hyphomonadaceae bacterium]